MAALQPQRRVSPLLLAGLADLRAVAQIVVCEHARHHRLTNRHGSDTNTRIMSTFGYDLSRPPVLVDGLAWCQN